MELPGNSLPTGIQVEILEGVPCLFGRYPTQKIPVGICLVPTGSGWNLWGTVKTSKSGGYQDKEHREWMYGVDFTDDGRYVTPYTYKDSARVSSSSCG